MNIFIQINDHKNIIHDSSSYSTLFLGEITRNLILGYLVKYMYFKLKFTHSIYFYF